MTTPTSTTTPLSPLLYDGRRLCQRAVQAEQEYLTTTGTARRRRSRPPSISSRALWQSSPSSSSSPPLKRKMMSSRSSTSHHLPADSGAHLRWEGEIRPQLALFQVSASLQVLWWVAWTPHAIVAQRVHPPRSNASGSVLDEEEPLLVCTMADFGEKSEDDDDDDDDDEQHDGAFYQQLPDYEQAAEEAYRRGHRGSTNTYTQDPNDDDNDDDAFSAVTVVGWDDWARHGPGQKDEEDDSHDRPPTVPEEDRYWSTMVEASAEPTHSAPGPGGRSPSVTVETPSAAARPRSSWSDDPVDDDTTTQISRRSLVLLKGRLVGGGGLPKTRLVLVVGTHHGRLGVVEWRLDRGTGAIECFVAPTERPSPLWEVLPLDPQRKSSSSSTRSLFSPPSRSKKEPSSSSQDKGESFAPTGGVKSLSVFRIPPASRRGGDGTPPVAHVWIAYGDGTLIRMHHAALFPSTWLQASHHGQQSLDDWLQCSALIRYQVRLPESMMMMAATVSSSSTSSSISSSDLRIIPLPKYHPSPLAPLITPISLGSEEEYDDDDDDDNMDDDEDHRRRGQPRQSRSDGPGDLPEPMEAIVLGPATDLFPTLLVYSTENLFVPRHPKPRDSLLGSAGEASVLGAVVGGTKKLVGSALGALLWGYTGTTSTSAGAPSPSVVKDDMSVEYYDDNHGEGAEPPAEPFPGLRRKPLSLCAGYELHDAPRQIETCVVDPDGELAAMTDTLGRVLLIDLSCMQVIRLWKGFRDANCYWAQTQQADESASWRPKTVLYLVIHSRQRRVVEVWRVRNGARVGVVQVGRDAMLVSCTQGTSPSQLASCFLMHSTVPGTSLNQLQKIEPEMKQPQPGALPTRRVSKSGQRDLPLKVAAQRLQNLQQLISANSVEYSKQDVYKALCEIKSLADLSTALDLLAKASYMEEKLELDGSELHKIALAYAREQLSNAEKEGAAEVFSNQHFVTLSQKVEFYAQILRAYDILYKFESSSEVGSPFQQLSTFPSWTTEAIGWVSTAEAVAGVRSDTETLQDTMGKIGFVQFASSCVWNEANVGDRSTRIYFSDSSKIRRDLLTHVFRPLLTDVFSFNVVTSIFDALGIKGDGDYVLKCFGDWFMTISMKQGAFDHGLKCSNPPILRFLQNIASRELDKYGASSKRVCLNTLYKFCEESEDLPRAFVLAVLARDAVSRASVQKENKSYGKITSGSATEKWETLIRKLRVCLLVSLRLREARMVVPLSVRNVEQEEGVSVYEWLALDELSMTHNQEEILSLEHACSFSSYAFDPSTEDGDGPKKHSLLTSSCLSAAFSEEERSEYLVDFDDDNERFGALLLFLRTHFDPGLLAAHRALILACEWSRLPVNMDLLRDSIVALRSLSGHSKVLLVAVCVEIWKTHISPLYRAQMFGFGDVPEISEEVGAPLLQDRGWFLAFGREALQILDILNLSKLSESEIKQYDLPSGGQVITWPPVRVDGQLKRLVERIRTATIDTSAIDAHSVVVSALLVSENVSALVQCVPSIYDCFMPQALFRPFDVASDVSSLQARFVEDAIVARALSNSGETLESFEMNEFQTLARVWGLEMKNIYTLYLLAMYEAGKDIVIDDLITRNSSQLNIFQFVDQGVDIACRRLNSFLYGKRLTPKQRSEVMGLLDADLCEWIQHRAENSRSLLPAPQVDTLIGATHLFLLRLLSLSAGANVDTTLRVKIHSLIVLSGILVKSLA